MKISLALILIILAVNCFAQTENIRTEIKADNIFDLSIIEIYPDSFPMVSVIFQAKNMFGKPLWMLDKSEVQVEENNQKCEVISLKNISENEPLNIGLVFDHSGSMMVSTNKTPEEVEAAMNGYYQFGTPLPEDFIMAIDYAKEGVLGFLNETGELNDSILFVGFSTVVDEIYPLTNDVSEIKTFVEGIEADGYTAFYDALVLSIDSLSKSSSKAVIVALSDGQDNASQYKYEEVIDLAKNSNIAIYNIGLGYVDTLLLNQISEETGGFFYHTNDPEKLSEIYLNIKEQIRSIYQVDYSSNGLDSLDQDRELRFSFVNDTLEFADHSAIFALSDKTISYINEREKQRITSQRNKIIYGGLGILLLGFAGFAIYRKKKENAIMTKAYPNPFINEITVEYDSDDLKKLSLRIFDVNGSTVFETKLTGTKGLEKFSLGNLKSGIYMIQVNNSKAVKVVKQ